MVQAVAIYFTAVDPHVAIAPRDDVVFKVMARERDIRDIRDRRDGSDNYADSDFPFVPFVSFVS